MDKSLEIAIELLEQTIPKYFTFRLKQTSVEEDGSISCNYTEKADELLVDILKVLEKHGI